MPSWLESQTFSLICRFVSEFTSMISFSSTRKTLPRLLTATIKSKEFHQVSVPQPGGGGGSGPLRTQTRPRDFDTAVQDEISRLASYRLEEEARRYVHGEVRLRTKAKMINIR